ncbi:MAG: type II secretion system protein [Alphaproteobacteria bacterium]|nr:type II secretion system protein [Alphaproteobacteria bacterium]
MLVELMMTVALAAIIIPFVFRYQQSAVERAKNIAVTKQMENVQNALERYIVENKTELMRPTGKNISQVKISDLVNYGLPEYIANTYGKDYQLRVLKSADNNNKSILQGIVILNNSEISPIRTREIVNLGGGKVGFVEGNITYGGFGAFRGAAFDFGISNTKGLVGITDIKRGNTEYLWRLPSENESDSTMLSPLNLDGHDIKRVRFLDAYKAQFEEKLKIGKLDVSNLVFTNRSTIDSIFAANSAVVNGTLTADSRNMNINGTLTLADSAKFSSFYTNDLYVNTLTLSGFSVSTESGKSSSLKIIGDMDLIMGRVTATYVSVGYTGSVTPQLNITDKIQDSKDSSFYWDIKNKKARFADINSPELARMASVVLPVESVSGTVATTVFGGVVANANATVVDYINAISTIQSEIRAKYEMLNL